MVEIVSLVALALAALCMKAMFRQEPPRITRRDYHVDVREFMSRTAEDRSKGEK